MSWTQPEDAGSVITLVLTTLVAGVSSPESDGIIINAVTFCSHSVRYLLPPPANMSGHRGTWFLHALGPLHPRMAYYPLTTAIEAFHQA